MAKAAKAVPEGLHTITPHLMTDNAARTIEWYKTAFGAVELSRSPGPDGKIMHAEIQIGDSRFYLNDAMGGAKAPQAYGGSPAGFWLYVEDSDTLFNRAVSAGAKVSVPLGDQFWGDRAGAVTDPEGYNWWISTRKEDLTRAELEERAAEFFKNQAAQS